MAGETPSLPVGPDLFELTIMAELPPPALRGQGGPGSAQAQERQDGSPAQPRPSGKADAAPRISGARPDQRPAAPAPQAEAGATAGHTRAEGAHAGRGPSAPERGTRQAYAAIDLGTNNCRLLIARPAGENFVVVDAFSRVVRLGEGLAQTGRLSDTAMDRALGALQICADKLRRRNVHLARSVATEACRRAENGAAFIERVRRETGIALDVISAQEEARLAVLGCHILLEQGEGPAMIFDIGGGS